MVSESLSRPHSSPARRCACSSSHSRPSRRSEMVSARFLRAAPTVFSLSYTGCKPSTLSRTSRASLSSHRKRMKEPGCLSAYGFSAESERLPSSSSFLAPETTAAPPLFSSAIRSSSDGTSSCGRRPSSALSADQRTEAILSTASPTGTLRRRRPSGSSCIISIISCCARPEYWRAEPIGCSRGTRVLRGFAQGKRSMLTSSVPLPISGSVGVGGLRSS